MTQNERVERLEFTLGTLIGSLWAAGKLDKTTQQELNYLLESDYWPITKPVGRVMEDGVKERTG